MEKTYRSIIAFYVFIILSFQSFCQSAKLDHAINSGNFKKAERIIKKKISEQNRRYSFGYDQQNKNAVPLDSAYSNIIGWLLKCSSVKDAFYDKCQMKISIYPGSTTIGILFKANEKLFEKCFYIQEGTTGDIKMFKWRFHVKKQKLKLVYKKMSDCEGFIQEQKKLCK